MHKQPQKGGNGERDPVFGKTEDHEDQANSKTDFRLTSEKLSQIAYELERAGIPVNALHIAGRLGVSIETLIATYAWKRAAIDGEVEP